MEHRGSMYVNQVQLICSSVDAMFMFQRMGLVTEVAADQPPVAIAETFEITMSLGHAKNMVAILIDQISQVEANIGRIPLDADGQKRFDAAVAKLKATK
jgi:hypothetical protein